MIALCTLQIALNITLLATLNWNTITRPLSNFYNQDEAGVKRIAYSTVSICTGLQLLFNGFTIQLLFLHRWLVNNNLTTFDYVRYLREKETNPNLQIADIVGTYSSKIIKKVDEATKTNVSKAQQNTETLSPESGKSDVNTPNGMTGERIQTFYKFSEIEHGNTEVVVPVKRGFPMNLW